MKHIIKLTCRSHQPTTDYRRKQNTKRTMHIPNNVHTHTLLQLQLYQTLFLRKVSISTQHDLPAVSPRYGFAAFEPLEHGAEELWGYAEFAVWKSIEFGACVGIFDVAATWSGG